MIFGKFKNEINNTTKSIKNTEEDMKDVSERVKETVGKLNETLKQHGFEVEEMSDTDGVAYNADKNITIAYSCTSHCDFAVASFNKSKYEVLAEYFKDTRERRDFCIGGWAYRKVMEDGDITGLCNHDHTLAEISSFLERI